EMLTDRGRKPDLPTSEASGDYGAVDSQDPADLIPRMTRGGVAAFDYDGEMRLTDISTSGISDVPTPVPSIHTTISHDNIGRVTETKQPLDASSGRFITNTYAYDRNGSLNRAQDPSDID